MSAREKTKAAATINIVRRDHRGIALSLDVTLPDSESRFNRCRSVRISEACWYRRFRSFSKDLLTISSSFGGTSGFSRTTEAGVRFRMDSKITPELSPRNGRVPVHISYSTAPKENKSVRASNSLALTCSGDI